MAEIAELEARAGTNIGITKKAYIKAFNRVLAKVDLRLEKFTDAELKDVYDTYHVSNRLFVTLKPVGLEQAEEITLSVVLSQGKEKVVEGMMLMFLGIAAVIDPDPTADTINAVTREFKEKQDEGRPEFSFEMGNKKISKNDSDSVIIVTIKPL